MGRRGVILGVASAIAVAAVIGTLGFAGYFTPPEEDDPLAGVLFSTDRSEYEMGDEVVFTLFNGQDKKIIRGFWRVERLVDGSWLPVERHYEPLVENWVDPGGSRTWRWTVVSIAEEYGPPYVSVEPGLYRGYMDIGVACDRISGECSGYFDLSTEFLVV